ncbi:mCG1042116 [Mus musculus]|nr:mCG1042116 [Mus musculus]
MRLRAVCCCCAGRGQMVLAIKPRTSHMLFKVTSVDRLKNLVLLSKICKENHTIVYPNWDKISKTIKSRKNYNTEKITK